MGRAREAWIAYRLRWKRRRLLWRAFRSRRALSAVADRTAAIRPGDILAFVTVRNEILRLPHFFDHYRRLGVGHFLIVDNGSDDGSRAFLQAQPDVSLWIAGASYKAARFGLDWLTWLMILHGHGHWCLTLDADEILVYPHCDERPLQALTGWLDSEGLRSFPAMLLDMYPEGRVGAVPYRPGDDPFATLCWFDAGNYSSRVQEPLGMLRIQGGPRARAFFGDDPRRAPTLNKVPLVKWDRRYVYVNSTHALLPRGLNKVYATDGGEAPSGVLLHSKFLNTVVARSREEMARGEHFADAAAFAGYYGALITDPVLWCEGSSRYLGWRHLEAKGLMSRGGWV